MGSYSIKQVNKRHVLLYHLVNQILKSFSLFIVPFLAVGNTKSSLAVCQFEPRDAFLAVNKSFHFRVCKPLW